MWERLVCSYTASRGSTGESAGLSHWKSDCDEDAGRDLQQSPHGSWPAKLIPAVRFQTSSTAHLQNQVVGIIWSETQQDADLPDSYVQNSYAGPRIWFFHSQARSLIITPPTMENFLVPPHKEHWQQLLEVVWTSDTQLGGGWAEAKILRTKSVA